MINETPFMKILDAAILTIAFVFNALVIDPEWRSIIIAIGGSLSGSVILAYFRRDVRKGEQLLKVIASAVGGLVLGTVLQEYTHIESEAYRLGLFFATSMLALVILRTLLNLTEQNAADAVKGILQRVFNLRLESEKTNRRVDRNRDRIKELEKKEGDK